MGSTEIYLQGATDLLEGRNAVKQLSPRDEFRSPHLHCDDIGFPSDSGVKNLSAMQEMRVRSPGQEDPLEEEITTHSSILDWRIPCTEETGQLQYVGS